MMEAAETHSPETPWCRGFSHQDADHRADLKIHHKTRRPTEGLSTKAMWLPRVFLSLVLWAHTQRTSPAHSHPSPRSPLYSDAVALSFVFHGADEICTNAFDFNLFGNEAGGTLG